MTDPDLRKLRVLRELSERGTVSAAAQALHLTPQAVSQQISALGRELGVPLTEPSGRRLRLTGAARIVLRHAEAVFTQVEQMRAELAAHQSGERGEVAVAGFSTTLSALILPAVARLRETRPLLRTSLAEVDPPESFSLLQRGEADVVISADTTRPATGSGGAPGAPGAGGSPGSGGSAGSERSGSGEGRTDGSRDGLTGGPAPSDSRSDGRSEGRFDGRFHRVVLCDDPFDIALPAGHRLLDSERLLLADLADETWIFATTGLCHDIGVAACTAAGFTPQASHAIGDWDATLAAVRLGLGVALVPRLAKPVPRPEVTIRPFSERAPSRTVFAAVREGSQTSPEIAAVLDALRTAARAAVAG
ncbi:LysR family transcriptional regulator [Streptomyces sp. TX20-6-3]|uniref:LysR family transcriptional regulator n=1 Tax=Streptomyces sp. TX20-6-3 TaxID=3028705 RepID=UPI0029B34DD4|nr:LysR family transcriptional regulator [Streptomyces sp. TX20-6-3]MDX2564310.1 LysR family transcriptional regulator [Streptomyces sp. TX20-6-3]